ncbi:YbaN family protein [Thalassoglobus polymorphus]|uniref:Inner membrane protein YbaN n=1 Tax=Thalassoglobus polymorphus TaxID=2527994 RepID=A0A517QV12_9PLAN|nr:YbaN family protein [Thalassoglobus polymorphus]QDT35427.1 Inner membrane protein YbaN [Thalassoglobus polymorphus]
MPQSRESKVRITSQQKVESPAPVRNLAGSLQQKVVSGWRRLAYLAVSGVFFLFAVIGILLPGIPTTPFLLVTSYFLVRCSPKLNEKLLNSKYFGPILNDWQTRGVVRRDVKVQAIAAVVIAVSLSLYFGSLSLIPSLSILAIAALGITVVLRLPEPNS